MSESSYQRARAVSNTRAGIGLGLRWDFLDELRAGPPIEVSCLEISPENYMRRGGYFPQALSELTAQYQFLTHGLTMSVGALDPAPKDYLSDLKEEIARVQSPWHSDHLCLSTAGPLVLHELLPLELNLATVQRVVDRIALIEDTLGVPFAVENISFYAHPRRAQLSEGEFLSEVLTRSGAGLLLDVNNVYVNAQNHGYDAREFISELPLSQVVQLHVAGHTRLLPPHPCAGLLLDTHGAAIIDPVFELLRFTLEKVGEVPVILERDNNVPELAVLKAELAELWQIYREVFQGKEP